MKIALLGTRGIPANYGGFETCVEEIGRRLAERGHTITVYCRESYYEDGLPEFLGMKRVCLPNLQSKSLDTFSHTCISAWHALFQRFDVYMLFNAANSPFMIPLRLCRKKIVINTDGLEWKRSKWGLIGRLYYKTCEKLSCIVANRLVSDSPAIKDYYRRTHKTETTEIAYGAYVKNQAKPRRISELGLKPHEYFLQITRFEPENNPLLTIRAFRRLKTTKKLVIVGGNRYPSDYTKQIEAELDDSVILPGFIYDQELLTEFWCFCYAYIHGNEVGGTNPALLQAMGAGCFTLAVDVQFNRDVLANCGIYYQKNARSLSEQMSWALDNESQLDGFKRKGKARIVEEYSWDKIADQYEALLHAVLRGEHPWRPMSSTPLT